MTQSIYKKCYACGKTKHISSMHRNDEGWVSNGDGTSSFIQHWYCDNCDYEFGKE